MGPERWWGWLLLTGLALMLGFITDYLLMFAPLLPGLCVVAMVFARTRETRQGK